MAKDFVGFRLRKVLDADLAQVIDQKTGEEISTICRIALRQAFGIGTEKRHNYIDVPVMSAPKVWKPTTKEL